MRRLGGPGFALALVALAAGACRTGTEIVVVVELPTAPPGAPIDELAVDLLSGAPADPMRTSATLQIAAELDDGTTSFSVRPGGYRGTLLVEITARAAGAPVAIGQASIEVTGGLQMVTVVLGLGSSDAGTDAAPDAAATDAAIDAGSECDFAEPELVAELSSGFDDTDPALDVDNLIVAFASNRPGIGDYDIWRATRMAPGDTFNSPTEDMLLQSPGIDGGPWGVGGPRLYFHSDRAGPSGVTNLYVGTDTGGGTWMILPIVELNDPADDLSPTLNDAETEIWFSSSRDDADDLFHALRVDFMSQFGPPVKIDELNSSYSDSAPTISADGLVLFFHSNRGCAGCGDSDLYVAWRSDAMAAWQPPHALSALNTSAREEQPFLSHDMLTLWFASDRPGGVSGLDIWRATRTCAPPNPEDTR
jgi:hypothetical protein